MTPDNSLDSTTTDQDFLEPDGIARGQNLIVDDNGLVGSVDLVTGELTEFLDTNITLTDIDVDPDGNVFGISTSQLYSIDLEAGTTTSIGSYGVSRLNALEIGEDGTFYATSRFSQDIFTLNPDTGEATSIGTSPISIQSAGDLQFINDTLYLADTEEFITFDVSGGTLNDATLIGSFNLEGESIFGITIDEDGDAIGLTNNGSILTLDLDTGEATPIGTVENNTAINGAAADPDGFFKEGNDTGSISGIKFNDQSGNGVRDSDEPGLEGVTIYLDLNDNGEVDDNESSQITDENGEYSFTGLEADTYIVREVIPENFEQTFPIRSISAGDGYADTILEYFAGENAPAPLIEPYGSTGGTPPASPFNGDGTYTVESVEPEVVLGAPPPSPIIGSNPEVDWLALPQGSYVTVGFTDEIIVDGEGDDIFIRSFDPEDSANENADVFVSSDGINFEFLGTVNEQGLASLDLADIGFNEPVTAVRVQGLDNLGSSPGFDLIGVEVLPNSIASPDFYTIELEEGEVLEGADFGNTNTVGEPVETPDDSEQDSLMDLEIQLQAFSPNLETPISEAVTTTIGDDVEFSALPSIELPGETLVDVNIDITQEGEGIASIFFEVDPNETFTTFASGEFNGYVFTDISDQIPAIENVTIDESTNTLGLEASDLTFTENRIEVNVESLTFNPEDTLLLNFEFADT